MGRIRVEWKKMMVMAAVGLGAAAHGAVVTAGKPVVTTQTTVSSSLQGATGNIAVNKFGDVFQASTWEGKIYEYPANGSAPIVLFQYGTSGNYSGKGLGGVAVDANNNLYVTTIYVGAQTSSDSGIYELPYVNGSYPSTFTLNAPVATCTAAPTTVCAWGNFLPPTGYYYQGWDFAIDGNGTGYLVTLYDNNSPTNNIYACNASCEARTSNGTILVGGLPNPVLSIAADAAGDVFYADGSANVYEVVAGTSTPVVIGTGFSTTVGVALDAAGNVYVTDSVGVFKISRVNGVYSSISPSQILAQGGASKRGYNGSGVAVDYHGNIYGAFGYSNLFKYNVNNGVFAATAASSTLKFNVVLNQAATGVTITPTGAQASQFTASNSTCGAGGAAGSVCSFTGTFQPSGVGQRTAALAVADSLGNTSTVSVSGVGQGSALTVDPGTLTQTGTGFSAAAGVAVDTAGNSYIADTTANAVYRYPAGGGARSTVGANLVSPSGVATDGAGNVYIADLGGTAANKGRVVQVPVVAGALSNAAQTVVATGIGSPKGVYVDGYGTLFVADSANARIFTLPPTQFGQTGGTTFGTGLMLPTDVVADSAGNLYVADKTAGLVIKISSEGVQSQIGSGFAGPTGVALDASGSLIVADQGNKRIVRVPNEAGVLNATDQTTILTSIAAPYAVRTDANANLVVSDNTANALYAVNRQVGAVTFSSVNVNTTSAAQSVSLSSSGNAGLALSSPLYTPPASPFALAQGKPPCTDGTTLAAGYVCVLSATFSPTVKGPASTSVSFTTNAFNTVKPSLSLSGTGLFLATPTVTLVQTSPTGTPTYGQTITLTATVAGTSANGGTPTGFIALVIDGATQPAVTLTNGTAVFTVTGQSGGQHIYQAVYQGDTNYASTASANLSITVAQVSSAVTLSIITDAVAPLSSAAKSTVVFNSTLTPAAAGFFSGTVNYVSNGNVLATGTVMPGPKNTYTASASTSTLAPGTYQVQAVYSGNANYTGSSSPVVTLIIVATPTIVVTPASTSLTSTANAPGSTTLTITSYAGFQGAVDFACSGLPANATCIFNPAVVTLIASSTVPPVTVSTYTAVLSIPVNQAPLVTPTAISPWAGALLLLLLLRVRRLPRTWRAVSGGLASLLLLVGMTTGLSGCGSSINNATPTGTSTITVTATSTPSVPGTIATSNAGTVTSSFTLQLTVK